VFSQEVKRLSKGSALIVAPEEVEYVYDNAVFIGYNANYYHWLIEELPRLSLAIRAEKLDVRAVLVDQNAREWQLELLQRFGFASDGIRRVDFTRLVKVRNVIVPSRLSTNGVAHPEAVSNVRATLLKGLPGTCRTGKRLYVTRDSAPGRSLLNTDEIISRFQRAGFTIVNPSHMSISEQIDTFSDAEVIAGPAGAGLSNTIFAPADARLIQLGPTDSCWETFTSIAAAVGQRSCWCLGRGFARPYKRWIWTEFDFVVDPDDVDLCLDRML
jgi:capsular polysaccharide biosynthesis protein